MLKNKAKNKILAKSWNSKNSKGLGNSKDFLSKPIICKTDLSKAIGLMFSRKKKTLIFIFNKEKLISLHMFFVFYPIDVLFLDKNKKVVQLKENFKPFRILIAKKPAKYIIELPDNTIKRTKTKVGDTIRFK